MKRALVSALRALDRRYARAQARRGADPPGLIVLLFHAVFASEEALFSGLTDPAYGVTVDQLRAVLRHFADAGYAFVSPATRPLPLNRPGVLLTFDDGYANNRLALPVLEAYDAPALFFVATAYVEQHRGYWWDTHYRERRRQGWTTARIHAEERRLSLRPPAEIEAFVRRTFGEAAFRFTGAADRPFRPDEITRLAASSLVHFGNHTHDHAALPACSDEEVRRQLRTAGRLLEAWTGRRAAAFAYPNGFVDQRVRRIVEAEGLDPTFSTRPVRMRPDRPAAFGAYGRFAVSGPDASLGRVDIDTQCALIRARRSLLRGAAALRPPGGRPDE